jgi:PIN domain nuclease of toxin-antitoxin system
MTCTGTRRRNTGPHSKDLQDPFDRLLIAQALTENLPILTADRIFTQYGAKIIW